MIACVTPNLHIFTKCKENYNLNELDGGSARSAWAATLQPYICYCAPKTSIFDVGVVLSKYNLKVVILACTLPRCTCYCAPGTHILDVGLCWHTTTTKMMSGPAYYNLVAATASQTSTFWM